MIFTIGIFRNSMLFANTVIKEGNSQLAPEIKDYNRLKVEKLVKRPFRDAAFASNIEKPVRILV